MLTKRELFMATIIFMILCTPLCYAGYTGGGFAPTATTNLNMASHAIYNVVDPVSAQDASTKNYVDTNTLRAAGGLSASSGGDYLAVLAQIKNSLTYGSATIDAKYTSGAYIGIIFISEDASSGAISATNATFTTAANKVAVLVDYWGTFGDNNTTKKADIYNSTDSAEFLGFATLVQGKQNLMVTDNDGTGSGNTHAIYAVASSKTIVLRVQSSVAGSGMYAIFKTE